MDNFDVKAFQQKCLEIMDAFDALCREKGLKYYMSCGTMLGAVRHKGFIPWDDDVDVYMPRPDYNLLMKHAKEWLPQNLNMINCDSDISFPHYYAKVEDLNTTLIERIYLGHYGGLWIDIFPVDGAAPNKFAKFVQLRRFKFWRRLLYFAYRDPWKHGKTFGGCLLWLMHGLLSKRYLHHKLQNVIRKYDYDKTDMVQPYDGSKTPFPKSVLGTPTDYEYEGRKYWGVEDYDTYLTIHYGDYMTPPPLEKQKVHHKIEFCDLNLPYREYMRQKNLL